MQMIVLGANVVCLALLFTAIKDSQRRLAAFGYAVAGFALVLALAFAATFVLVPSHGSVIDVNEALDKIGRAAQIAAPIAAVWAANIPPRRTKA